MALAVGGLLAASFTSVSTRPAPAVTAGGDQAGGEVLVAQDFIQLLTADEATNLSFFTISGDVQLSRLQRLARPLRCQNCRFTGSFVATDLIVERIVDFSGSVFEGPVDVSAALFRDRAGFERVTFEGPVTFSSTKFAGEASFADANFEPLDFEAPADFGRAQFASRALFSSTAFNRDAGFQAAQFEAGADFSGARFAQESNFQASVFGKRVSFARALFNEVANFRGATLVGGGNLGVNRFNKGVGFEEVSAGGSTEFLGAVLLGEGGFNNFTSTGRLALEGIRLLGDAKLYLDHVAAKQLTMDVDQIGRVPGPRVQRDVLKQVEAGARESGDLALANRARFQFLDLEGQEKTGWRRVVDRVFFRDVAGYLVKPVRPLISLAILILICGLIRSQASLRQEFVSWRETRSERVRVSGLMARMRVSLKMVGNAVERLFTGIGKAANVAFRRKPSHIPPADPDQPRAYGTALILGTEFFVYKLMIALFLLALGNSNATVRQLLDAVTG